MMMRTSEIDMANSVEPTDIDSVINSLTPKSCYGPVGGNEKLSLGRLFAS